MQKSLRILGTRGIPAQHGGFETFAEHLAPYLHEHGWEVTVYCQEEGSGDIYKDEWNGVKLVHIPVNHTGAFGTIVFDWKSTLHAMKTRNPILTLGYNTAIFCLLYRINGISNLINMDGIEWKRDKWTFIERIWLLLNERAGCLLGNHLIADHPEIKSHLASRVSKNKITMIPYGSDSIESADISQLDKFGLEPDEYAIVIARPEPENSILEIITAFSQKKRDKKLVVLGNYDKANPEYNKKVKEAASDEVIFPGAIYDKSVIRALRYYACLYVHGHTVGGTNPSLVEALGAGNAVLAHDNKYNRWVAGARNKYFKDTDECKSRFDEFFANNQIIEELKVYSRKRHKNNFTWIKILQEYQTLINNSLN